MPRRVLGALGIAVLLVTLVSGTAVAKSKTKVKPLPTFTRSNYAMLVNAPKQYKGASVNISGQVFSTPPTGQKGYSAVQMWMDPANDNWNTVVVYKSKLLRPPPSDQDYLHIIGIVSGAYKYKSSLGGQEIAVLVLGLTIKETTVAATELPIAQTGVAITSCGIDQYDNQSVDISGTITNPTNVTSDYDITISIISGGVRVGTAEDFETAVVPGQPTNWSTIAEITGGNGSVTCQLTGVKLTNSS